MAKELISIITPSYKPEKYISLTLESVLSQHYQDWELIIVDDCSPNNSNEIVSEYIKKDKRIKLLRFEKSVGPAGARNVGIKEAKGRYVALLDSDDLWKPQKLTEQIKFMQEFNLTITYCSYELIDKDNKSLGTFITKEEIIYKDLLKNNYIATPTVIYDTQKLGKFLCLFYQWQKIMQHGLKC